MMTDGCTQSELVCGLMPVRNAMPYLRQTLESIAAQTHTNLYLIAWDNGSTDGSVEELKRWVPHRIRGRVVTDHPLPLGRCRAALVEQADSELCAWFDADDLYRPERISVQVQAIRDNPDAVLVGSAMRVIDASGNLTGEVRRYECDDAEIRWALRFSNPIAQPTVLFKRSAILAAGNYPDVPGEEDYEMWLRLSLTCKLINLNQPLIDYRVHASNVTKLFTQNRQQHIKQRQQRLHNLLFPAMGQAPVEHLYRALCPHTQLPIGQAEVKRLSEAACCLAKATGLSPQAIYQTKRYREQWRNLQTRRLKSTPGLHIAWPAAKRVLSTIAQHANHANHAKVQRGPR